MRPFPKCALIIATLAAVSPLRAAFTTTEAANVTNQTGVDLYRQLAHGDDNLCLSPYSIETALAMTFAGADGETKTEMERVLHLPSDGKGVHAAFAALRSSLTAMLKGRSRSPSNPRNAAHRASQSRFQSRTI